MVMKSYLDALTPGMMARLDPGSRNMKGERTEHWASLKKNGGADSGTVLHGESLDVIDLPG